MEALGRSRSGEKSITSALDMFTVRSPSSDICKQNCATSNCRCMKEFMLRPMMLMSPKMTDNRHCGGEDSCKPEVKNHLEGGSMSQRHNRWAELQKRSVCLVE